MVGHHILLTLLPSAPLSHCFEIFAFAICTHDMPHTPVPPHLQKRFSSKEVLQHPWFAAHLKTTPISENINQALQVFRALMRKKLKGTMYASLAMASMRRLSAGSMYGGARRSSTKYVLVMQRGGWGVQDGCMRCSARFLSS